MLTDGLPTVNNGPNHRYDGGAVDDDYHGNDTGNDDLKSARYTVNALRTGSAIKNWLTGTTVYQSRNPNPAIDLGTRQPVNVIGVMVETDAKRAEVQSNMNYVFGAKNTGWYYADNFGGSLSTALSNSLGKLTCKEKKGTVDPKISLTVSNPSTVIEDQEITFTVTAKNVTTTQPSGIPASLVNVKIRLGGPNGTMICPEFNLVSIGSSHSCTYTFRIPLGADAPTNIKFYVDSIPFFDGSLYDFAPNASKKPSQVKTGTVAVKRIPLPA